MPSYAYNFIGYSVDDRPQVMPGDKWNSLTILSHAGSNKFHQKLVRCRCDCGVEKSIVANSIRLARTKSCGCLHDKLSPTHGFKKGWRGELPPGAAASNQILKNYRRRARVKKMEFTLGDKEFFKLMSGRCVYCGVGPSTTLTIKRKGRTKVDSITYNGIDRIDSRRGYTAENSVPCCATCNMAKSDMSLADFKTWVNRVQSKINS